MDVLTKEVRNAKLHVENLTVEQHEAKLKRGRVESMSEEAHEHNKIRSRVENMTGTIRVKEEGEPCGLSDVRKT